MKTSGNIRYYSSYSRLFNTRSRHTLLLAVLCALGLIFTSCGSDSSTGPGGSGGDGGNGGGNEPPAEPTYANVQGIFNSSCGGSGCHVGETTSGVRLDSYDNIMNSVGDQYGENVVQPENADGSPLVDKIESSSPEYGVRMPNGGSPLADDQTALIREWIDNGAEEGVGSNNGGNNGGNSGGNGGGGGGY